MDFNFAYLNTITVMSDITQKLHSGILLPYIAEVKAISQTPQAVCCKF